MMGLITIHNLYTLLEGKVIFYSDFDEYLEPEQLQKELNLDIKINTYVKTRAKGNTNLPIFRQLYLLRDILSNKDAKAFDMVVVLGGDDLSEYYGKHVWPVFLSLYSWSFKTKIVLFGQSIGPFKFWLNRFSFRKLASRCKIFTRDEYCFNYLKNDLKITKNVSLSGDIAFLELPLETNTNYETVILKQYGLQKDKYVTIVISGLFGKYYTNNKNDYFNSYKQLVKQLKNISRFKDFKICFLAHTFPPHGNEAELLTEFETYMGNEPDLVFIKEKVYQAAARFILGNGVLTITGRMHASVSTFEMGKPSISLAYSVKYYGVIGDNLQRSDLIINANDPNLWQQNKISDIITNKVNYTLDQYPNMVSEIQTAVKRQKQMVNSAFTTLINDLN